eukprot:gene7607-7809_t
MHCVYVADAAATVAADTAISQLSAANDEKEVQTLPDQGQLLDLVQTLIADHRYSLLERQRLQQQLEATQQALQVVKLDKDRAVVLADLRSEEASQARANLADAAAAAQRSHALQAITANDMCLPLPPPAANGGRAQTDSSSTRATFNAKPSEWAWGTAASVMLADFYSQGLLKLVHLQDSCQSSSGAM